MGSPLTADGGRTWERRNAAAQALLPYVLLAVSTVLSLAEPGADARNRLLTAGLAAIAGAWVLVMFTWMDSRWPWRTAGRLVYVGGLLVICGVLVAHSPFFIAFTVTCFAHALFLLPPPFAFVGVALSSIVVFLVPTGLHFHTAQDAFDTGLVIGLETLVVGGLGFLAVRARDELLRSLATNAELHARLLAQAREAGRVDERARVAREIHDTLAQGLTGIITQLEAAQQAGDRFPQVEQATVLARESLTEARRSVLALRPTQLEEARLPDAIAEMARRWSETSSVALTFTATGEPRPLLAELEVTLFRAAQEALANVASHAHASRVGLTVSYMEDVVLLDVRDDGVGFDPAAADRDGGGDDGRHFGLRAMDQRLRQVGGELEIESAPGGGTAINARVPAILAEAGA
jgi:signal transduction histidine kinase